MVHVGTRIFFPAKTRKQINQEDKCTDRNIQTQNIHTETWRHKNTHTQRNKSKCTKERMDDIMTQLPVTPELSRATD